MAVEGSLNQSLDKAVKHYSSLFELPSSKKMLLFLTLTCLFSGLFPALFFFPFADGLFLGLLLLVVDLIFSYAISRMVFRDDPIYDLRRTTALSLFSRLFWFLFIFIGVLVAQAFGLSLWVKLCLLGFPAVVMLRLVVLYCTSAKNQNLIAIVSISQPFCSVFPFLFFWLFLTKLEVDLFFVILFLTCSIVVSIGTVYAFILILNRVGKKMLGSPSLPLLRAFLLNWIVDLNKPLEELLEKLGEEQSVEVSVLKFDCSKPKAVMIVPTVHPGPFKNVGSSLLPYQLKASVETKLGCVVAVPLGLLGHELDLASQAQSEKVVDNTTAAADFKVEDAFASPFVKVTNGLATACCQIFGKNVFISFSLAPKTTEDLPQELGTFVKAELEQCRLIQHVAVNAHNSIDGVVDNQEVLESLKAVARECLKKASSLKLQPFKIGVASVVPKEFSLQDGMGFGGITVFVVEVNKQKAAYVIIDGNNMIVGLREKILSALQSLGVDNGEVFTTDTHSVNAVTLSGRGYHPVGEAIDCEMLIRYIVEATHEALANLENAKAGVCKLTVSDVKVIGEKALSKLCLLTDVALRTAKRIVIPVFATAFLVLMFLLLLF